MTKENLELREKLDYLQDKYLRLAAEFDNYRKRVQKEKSELIETASERVIYDLLEILDDMERGLQAEESEFTTIMLKKTRKILESHGLKEITVNPGDTFDLNIHEAVSMYQDPKNSGKVLSLVLRGYSLGGKIIRYPKVIVAQ